MSNSHCLIRAVACHCVRAPMAGCLQARNARLSGCIALYLMNGRLRNGSPRSLFRFFGSARGLHGLCFCNTRTRETRIYERFCVGRTNPSSCDALKVPLASGVRSQFLILAFSCAMRTEPCYIFQVIVFALKSFVNRPLVLFTSLRATLHDNPRDTGVRAILFSRIIARSIL